MIGYVTLGANDFEKAKSFYDVVLADLGAKRTMTNDRMQGYGSVGGGPMLAVRKPYDGGAAKDEGAPGLRGDQFYGAYFRDPDGNKLRVFNFG